MEIENIKILAIDDTFDNLITLKALIYESFPEAIVLTALNGLEGIRLASSELPDVILLDVVMPNMDGFEVCKQLKSNACTNGIPVVFVTALKGDSNSRINALEVGAEAFIAKPIDQSELVAQIRAMAKIKIAHDRKKNETAHLAALVAERTLELKANNLATLNLLEDLQNENDARKRTEEALRESEEKYRFLTDNSSDVIWHLDSNFICDYISSSDERMRGFHQDEVLGTPLWSLLKPEGIELVKKLNSERLKDEASGIKTGTIHYEIEQLCKNGSWIWTEADASVHLDENGVVIGYFGATRDITERKKAQDALWQSEEKYRTLVQYSSDPIFSYNLDETYRFVNESFGNLFGLTPGVIIGKRPHDIMSEEEAEKRISVVRQVFKTGKKAEIEVKVIHPSGDKRYFITMADPIKNEQGEVMFVSCISKDITERKLAEKALKIEKRKVETYLNIAQVILVAFDKNGTVNLLNKKGHEVLGYEPGELTNKNWFEACIPPEEVDNIKEVFSQIITAKSNSFNYYENQVITKQGERRTIAWNNTWVTDNKGNITGALSSGEDITERKIAEEALRMSEDKYSNAFQTSPYAITITRTSDGKIMDVNNAFTTITGYTKEESINKTTTELKTWTDAADRKEVVVALSNGRAVNGWEFTFRRKNGELMTGLYSAQLLSLNGEKLILSSINDITDRKIAEQQLQHVGRLYAFLSQINQAIVRTSDKNELLKLVCEVAVEFGQFKMAWIGIVDENNKVVPVSFAGEENGYLNHIHITINDEPAGKGPIGTAIKTGEMQVCENTDTDLRMQPWKKEALKRGFKSSLALPFRSKGKVIGSVNFYSDEISLISEDERNLFEEVSEDITFALEAIDAAEERRLAQIALEESELKYREFVENSPEAISIYAEGKVVYVNKESVRMMRADSKDDLLGMEIINYIHPDNRASVFANMQVVAQTPINGILPPVEEKYIRLDGTPIFVEVKAMPIMLDNKPAVQLTARDITDRKKAEEALENSRNELKAIYDFAPVMMCVVDKNGEILFANKAFSTFTGTTQLSIHGGPGDVFGCINSFESEHGCGHSKFCSRCVLRNSIAHTFSTGKEVKNKEYETELVRSDGRKKTSLLFSTALIINDGQKNLLLSLHDITDRKQAEASLLQSEARLESMFEYSPIAIWEEDFSMVKNQLEYLKKSGINDLKEYFTENPDKLKNIISKVKVIGINETSLKIFGTKTKNEIFTKLDELFTVTDETTKVFIDEMIALSLGKTRFEGETLIMTPGGRKKNLLLTLTVMPGHEHTLSKVLVSFIDITQRKEAEDALQKSEMFLRAFIENTPFEIWARDMHNIGILENKKLVDHYGSILGLNPLQSKSNNPELHALWEDNNRRAYGGELIDEIVKVHDNNEEIIYQQLIFPIQDEESTIGIAGFNIDITERIRAEISLRESQEQLKQFAAHLQNIREDERTGLAREIHDDLGQILVALKIDMGLLKNKVIKNLDKDVNGDIIGKFDNLVSLVDNTIKTTRRIMTGLRPEVLEMLGFVETTRLYALDFEERHKVKCSFDSTLSTLDVSPQQSVALFRILQEALTNVIRHAKATKVSVQLLVENNKLVMEIIDNGVGFPENHKLRNDSYGLLGMKERVFLLEGNLLINGKTGEGTKVRIEMPYNS